jgi:hypothetical protein
MELQLPQRTAPSRVAHILKLNETTPNPHTAPLGLLLLAPTRMSLSCVSAALRLCMRRVGNT